MQGDCVSYERLAKLWSTQTALIQLPKPRVRQHSGKRTGTFDTELVAWYSSGAGQANLSDHTASSKTASCVNTATQHTVDMQLRQLRLRQHSRKSTNALVAELIDWFQSRNMSGRQRSDQRLRGEAPQERTAEIQLPS